MFVLVSFLKINACFLPSAGNHVPSPLDLLQWGLEAFFSVETPKQKKRKKNHLALNETTDLKIVNDILETRLCVWQGNSYRNVYAFYIQFYIKIKFWHDISTLCLPKANVDCSPNERKTIIIYLFFIFFCLLFLFSFSSIFGISSSVSKPACFNWKQSSLACVIWPFCARPVSP